MVNQLLKLLKRTTTKRYLILVPFAGGYSASFRPLSQLIQSDWNILAIEPPGHGANREPLIESIEELVDLYLEQLLPVLSNADSFVLFGHSMGGLVVHNLTQRLEAAGLFPEQVIISGITPPDAKREPVVERNDEDFLEYVVSLGGIPDELLKYKELIELFLPVLRNDFRAVESYDTYKRTTLQTPVHVFSGEEDPRAYPEAVRGWSEWAEQATFYEFQGGHMFVLSEAQAVAEQLDQLLGVKAKG
ncbi:MAG TPA: alpha/beta fold hydrolase [Bacilli bacterium]|nr:alpha/beta fold hydrolase [Bacilli bacterium]